MPAAVWAHLDRLVGGTPSGEQPDESAVETAAAAVQFNTLRRLLDPERGAVEPAIRSEIFGAERFAQHGHSLAETHTARPAGRQSTAFFPRLRDNIRVLRESHAYIRLQASTGYEVSPAAVWLLDNFHLVEAQLQEIHDGLPRSYFRHLPVLEAEPLGGLPRVYGVAWAFVAHTDGAFDDPLLTHFLGAYQQTRELTLGELWALPTTLRVVLIENLRRLAERMAVNKAARELANLCSDRLTDTTPAALDELLLQLDRRGVRQVFLAQMAQRLCDPSAPVASDETAAPAPQQPWLTWLTRALPDLAAVQTQQPADQAADNLSVGNAITSLRLIGDADWQDIVARVSTLMKLMLGAPWFADERDDTRDETLHGIERLARRGRRSELEVAHVLLALMQPQAGSGQTADAATGASYWLSGAGRPQLLHALGLHDRLAGWRAGWQRMAFPAYLAALAIGTVALVAALVARQGGALHAPDESLVLFGLTLLTLFFPASEAMIAVVNRLISESARPRRLPRLALPAGIPVEHRVLVAVPALLTSESTAGALAHRLHLHYLANPQQHAQFALLTDYADAGAQQQPGDLALLTAARRELSALNAQHPAEAGQAPRFVLLHRERSFSESEQCWIGHERKRGKLELLVQALVACSAGEPAAPDKASDAAAGRAFIDLGAASRLAPGTRYIITLDSDTELPPGRLRDLVGVAAHPDNRPRYSADGSRVIGGYGVLQPRVATPLPALSDATPYHWLFAGQCGIDPYSAAASEVYQDLFGEGTFTGKGLLNVEAVHKVLLGRLPDAQVLSHDLLEGSIARCAAVTDITVIEDAPFHADVAAARVHRWTRGDWQLLPLLLQRRHYGIGGVHVWKMTDNLRRSLVAPMSLGLLVLTLAADGLSPWAALGLVFAAFAAGPLMGALTAFAPSRDDIAKRHFYREAAVDALRAVTVGLWLLSQLLQQATLQVDAIARAVWRSTVSRRRLLQWTTAAASQASVATGLLAIARRHWRQTLGGVVLLGALLQFASPMSPSQHLLAWLLCIAWATSPLSTWWASTPPTRRRTDLPSSERERLMAVARDTWRLFERCVGPADHQLPPDNLQSTPHDMVAHRTSPTNIGLYLLSAACAREFGWIGTQDLLLRLEATLATLQTLQRHRGHFLNWYDTSTATALLPLYVSTVDSGNLSGHLLAVAQACLRLAEAPFDGQAGERAGAAAQHRVTRLRADASGGAAAVAASGVAIGEADDPLAWAEADLAATLHSGRLDRDESARHGATAAPAAHQQAAQRLRAVAASCQQLAWAPDYAFLYHRKRRLFHIGWRVTEQQLDASFYDLLASEARLTSLLAIAKADVPPSHWAALGRPFYAIDAAVGLRSWSGSMFEYLMPSLVLDEPRGSVLHSACEAAVREQMAFARAHHVPWGISESAYAASDHTLAYQYAPQGVPRLALRRTPEDELVIAPYATALAAMVAPRAAAENLRLLETGTARGRYGFIEALDYTPTRRSSPDQPARVDTFMAHHQGMTIVALANVLLDGLPRRWGMADARLQAVASLLHEQVPRQVSSLRAPPELPVETAVRQRSPGLVREVRPGELAVEPTQLLSNGRYAVTLRANGAGTSRCGNAFINRWRDDALRDAYGSFFYLRWDRQPEAVSLTQHPAPDPNADYRATFHADRVCFDTSWPELRTRVTVFVSPEDDIEFRQVEIHNLSGRQIDAELLSAFEPTLADARADEAHPAFGNLFISARWQPAQQALLFERKPRLANERALHVAHFVVDIDARADRLSLRVQADRRRWLGRNGNAARPLASFDADAGAVHAVEGASQPAEHGLDTGLDPIAALAARVRIAPHSKVSLAFCTTASLDAPTLHAVIDKHRQSSHIARASLMSATLSGIRLRDLRIDADTYAAAQSLSTALLLSLTRPSATPFGAPPPASSAPVASLNARAAATATILGAATAGALPGAAPGAHDGAGTPPEAPRCDRRLLWRFGISGDKPILLVSASEPRGLALLRSAAQALQLWAWGGVACDLVVINAEPSSYLMTLQRELTALRERHAAASAAMPDAASCGFFVLRSEELGQGELSTLRTLARVRLNADGRPLAHHVRDWLDRHERAFEQRQDGSHSPLPMLALPGAARPAASAGDFDVPSGEFRFDVAARQRPPRPWVNVLANPIFGAQVSEAGGGYSWALNSRLNQLTPWSNDPVADPPGEWFLLQDMKTLRAWSVAASAWGDPSARYRVAHGQGYTQVRHRSGELEVTVSWCVDAVSAVKHVRIRLINRGHRNLKLRAIGMVEWVMGANRSDRASADTQAHLQRLSVGSPLGVPTEALTDGPPAARRIPAAAGAGAGADGVAAVGSTEPLHLTALLCTQRDHAAGFGDGTAFLALAGPAGDAHDWTCDRREWFDARGRLIVPDHLAQRSGTGLDPCAAIASTIDLPAGETAERVFLLGWAASPDAACTLAARAAAQPAGQRMERSRAMWDELLGAATVKTPDPLFDALVNRWLLYQTVACRMWAKAGFYQAGGAFGYRDQLQDSMALAWARPALLREQIVLGASRQFHEGDVQHWWHAPTGAGVRTHFSDDLLWLPHATVHYLGATGDSGLLDEEVSFIDGGQIPPGAEDAYYAPTRSDHRATVYEHCARAIDKSITAGAHGLPLMGTGDWNDGMNRVGHEGHGESVWLAWFLCRVVADFAPLARQRHDAGRAERWEQAAISWRAALHDDAWDGQWFKRAFFDDGSALGSSANAECRIDLIAQAWSVLSGAAQPAYQRMAMAALDAHLVDRDAGLLRLLDPPLAAQTPSAGYIQAYPPGVRENGGQYSHAGVWALMAQAQRGNAAAAWYSFTCLSPAHRSANPQQRDAYELEPYVMAGDVYSQPPFVGRGGWSWYTGSAAWLQRAAVESIFGLRLRDGELSFVPCLPPHWPQAEMILRRADRVMRFVLHRDAAGVESPVGLAGALQLRVGEVLHWRELPQDCVFLIRCPTAGEAAASYTPQRALPIAATSRAS